MSAPSTGKITTLATGLNFPECPRWHADRVWFVDGSHIKVVEPGAEPQVHAELPALLTLGLAIRGDGSMLTGACAERIIYEVDRSGEPRVFADLSDHFANFTNEVILDRRGGAYVGCMGFDLLAGEAPATSILAYIDPSGAVRSVGTEVLFPNGLLLSPEGNTLYVSETFASKISTFDVADNGDLDHAAVLGDLGGRPAHHPDGIALEPDGSLWYADSMAGSVVHLGTDGEELDSVKLEQGHATSCCLGGAEGRTLFITATDELPELNVPPSGQGVLLAIDV